MWFYAKDGQKSGPVPEGELDSLAARGVIDASTLVWKDGLAEWLPLATARPGVPIPKAGQEACSQCGMFHSPEDLVAVSGLKICAACKPAVVQRIREGLPLTNLENAWRDRNLVVAEAENALPNRCFRCNSRDTHRTVTAKMQRSFMISSPHNVQIHFCTACYRKGLLKRWGSGILVVLVVVVMVSSRLSLGLALLLTTAALGLGMLERSVRLKKAKGTSLWISGAGRPFLDSLPKWPN